MPLLETFQKNVDLRGQSLKASKLRAHGFREMAMVFPNDFAVDQSPSLCFHKSVPGRTDAGIL
jgi:hypothetical protein